MHSDFSTTSQVNLEISSNITNQLLDENDKKSHMIYHRFDKAELKIDREYERHHKNLQDA